MSNSQTLARRLAKIESTHAVRTAPLGNRHRVIGFRLPHSEGQFVVRMDGETEEELEQRRQHLWPLMRLGGHSRNKPGKSLADFHAAMRGPFPVIVDREADETEDQFIARAASLVGRLGLLIEVDADGLSVCDHQTLEQIST